MQIFKSLGAAFGLLGAPWLLPELDPAGLSQLGEGACVPAQDSHDRLPQDESEQPLRELCNALRCQSFLYAPGCRPAFGALASFECSEIAGPAPDVFSVEGLGVGCLGGFLPSD